MIEIIYVQFDTTHEEGFFYLDDSRKHDWWLLLQTHTPAYFITPGGTCVMPKETAILYPPYSILHYGAHNDIFKNDWIRFYTDEAFIIDGKIPTEMPFQVMESGFIHHLFQLLASENFFQNKYKKQTVHKLFELIFTKLEESLNAQSENPQLKGLSDLRLRIKNDPGFDWNIPYMADLLHVSIGYLHSLYRKTFGISCMDDVIQMRLTLARDYLRNSSETIQTIAKKCGYKNVEHFSRQFKKLAGMSPRQYRLSYFDSDSEL